jgi:hypothetical protein
LLAAWTNESLSSIQRNALISHLVPYGYGDLEDVVDIYLDATDTCIFCLFIFKTKNIRVTLKMRDVQLMCKQRISRNLQTTIFPVWEHLLQKIGKPIKRAQIEEEAKNIKKAILSKFDFVKKKIAKEDAQKAKSATTKTTKITKITKTKSTIDDKSTTKEPTTKNTTKSISKDTKPKDSTDTAAKEPAKAKSTKSKETTTEPAPKETSKTITTKTTKTKPKSTTEKDAKETKEDKGLSTTKTKELTETKSTDTKTTKEAKTINGTKPTSTKNDGEMPEETVQEEQEKIDKEEELNRKRFAMVETFRDALLQYVAKGTKGSLLLFRDSGKESLNLTPFQFQLTKSEIFATYWLNMSSLKMSSLRNHCAICLKVDVLAYL